MEEAFAKTVAVPTTEPSIKSAIPDQLLRGVGPRRAGQRDDGRQVALDLHRRLERQRSLLQKDLL
jgi:hypothetical protein